jgi:hypothetical protein
MAQIFADWVRGKEHPQIPVRHRAEPRGGGSSPASGSTLSWRNRNGCPSCTQLVGNCPNSTGRQPSQTHMIPEKKQICKLLGITQDVSGCVNIVRDSEVVLKRSHNLLSIGVRSHSRDRNRSSVKWRCDCLRPQIRDLGVFRKLAPGVAPRCRQTRHQEHQQARSRLRGRDAGIRQTGPKMCGPEPKRDPGLDCRRNARWLHLLHEHEHIKT